MSVKKNKEKNDEKYINFNLSPSLSLLHVEEEENNDNNTDNNNDNDDNNNNNDNMRHLVTLYSIKVHVVNNLNIWLTYYFLFQRCQWKPRSMVDESFHLDFPMLPYMCQK